MTPEPEPESESSPEPESEPAPSPPKMCTCNLPDKSHSCSITECIISENMDENGNCFFTSYCPVTNCVGSSVSHCITANAPIPYCTSLCTCDGVCSQNSKPCDAAQCLFDQTIMNCSWQYPLAGCPPIGLKKVDCNITQIVEMNTTISVVANNSACNIDICPDPNTAVCVPDQWDTSCSVQCPSSTAIDYVCSCQGSTSCENAQCTLLYVNSQPTCQLVCPNDICTSFCSQYVPPYGYELTSCGVNPSFPSGCLPSITSYNCTKDSNCNTPIFCPSGYVSTCDGSNECGVSCVQLQSSNPCVVDNVSPVCAITSGPAPCVNDVCSFNSDNDTCTWQHSDKCIRPPSCTATDTPQCANSICQTATGSDVQYWDNTPCQQTLVCPSLDVTTCPFGRQCANGQPGGCALGNDGNCIWQCPGADCSCLVSDNNVPTPGSFGCASWISLCVTSPSGTCGWEYECTAPNTGPCNTSDCGAVPTSNDTECTDPNYNCARRCDGACVWQPYCPANLSDTSPCDPSTCSFVPPPEVSFCGLAPLIQSCIRVKGQCQTMWECGPQPYLPPCQFSKCHSMCYDPRWLDGSLTPPTSFSPGALNNESLSTCPLDSICNDFKCNRPPGSPYCQLIGTDNDNTYQTSCINSIDNSIQPTIPYSPCSGNDPCTCNYTAGCTYVSVPITDGVLYGECLDQQQLISIAGGLCGITNISAVECMPDYCSNEDQSTGLPDLTNQVMNTFGSLNSYNFQNYILTLLGGDNTLQTFLPQIPAPCLPVPDAKDNTIVHLSMVVNIMEDLGDQGSNLCSSLAGVLSNNLGISNLENCLLSPVVSNKNSYILTAILPTVSEPSPYPSPESKSPSTLPSPTSHPKPQPSTHIPVPKTPVAHVPVPLPSKPTPPHTTTGSQIDVWPALFLSFSFAIMRLLM